MLGAALAYANGADPLAGGSAAVTAERAAGYLAKQYDDGHTAIDPTTSMSKKARRLTGASKAASAARWP
ncbi:hypothetical protein CGZ77_06955 [Neisseria sp. KEM232]|nr:hypothetical protein CGZ77_06955 [Neisseria sp. KEM232]